MTSSLMMQNYTFWQLITFELCIDGFETRQVWNYNEALRFSSTGLISTSIFPIKR